LERNIQNVFENGSIHSAVPVKPARSTAANPMTLDVLAP